MRGFIKKISLILFCILISTSQVGCTVGEYKVFDFDVDDNGNLEFMLIGQRGPSGNIEETELETLDEEMENEDLVEKSNDMQESAAWGVNNCFYTNLSMQSRYCDIEYSYHIWYYKLSFSDAFGCGISCECNVL